jgi:hypothetical protein
MTEYDGLSFAPVLVENLDAVFSRDGGHGHISCAARKWTSNLPHISVTRLSNRSRA